MKRFIEMAAIGGVIGTVVAAILVTALLALAHLDAWWPL